MEGHSPLTQLTSLTIEGAATALERGDCTAVELVAACLDRIAAFDRSGPRLNAVPVLNPDALREAAESDDRRARGEHRGILDGIPYTAKASFAVAGLPTTAGSPAFADLIAREDAFSIGRLRAAGAICVGLTNMPPLAAGGMQRGLYGRAESPYNARYLTSAWASGSSNGSGTATASGFGVFGLGEETWSSGRAPASCNALVAYTPSRGLISIRGNWPLVPTMDVVVPHTRTMSDLLHVLDVLVADDEDTRGDFWRAQPWVPIGAANERRPESYPALAETASLAGVRLGVPRMYVGDDRADADQIVTRASVLDAWARARRAFEAAGATVDDTGFPALRAYEGGHKDGFALDAAGYVPSGYLHDELWDASLGALDEHIRLIGDPHLPTLASVDGERVFPHPPGQLPDRYPDTDPHLDQYPGLVAQAVPYEHLDGFADGVHGLERARRELFEDWLDKKGLDALVFPTLADVAPADADTDQAANDLAWRNGTWVANGNLLIRHLGIPSVTVPLGLMNDIGMPIGLTIIGRGDDDARLLALGAAIERVLPPRSRPGRAPELTAEPWHGPVIDDDSHEHSPDQDGPRIDMLASAAPRDGGIRIDVSGHASPGTEVHVRIAGESVPVHHVHGAFMAHRVLPADEHQITHSPWRGPYGTIVTALARDAEGRVAGASFVVGGIA